MNWDDSKIVAADLETSGKLPEYALQPWRMARGDMWITSGSMIRHAGDAGLVPHLSQLFPSKTQLMQMLQDAIDNDWTILGWNIAFDISMLMALGKDVEALCFKVKWLDGMLIERHYDIEPEYEFQTKKHLKKSYSLKGFTDNTGRFFPGALQRWLPDVPAYNEGIDFHAVDPDSLYRLQRYNDEDNVYTWIMTMMIWAKLTTRQRQACLIQADALPRAADAWRWANTLHRAWINIR